MNDKEFKAFIAAGGATCKLCGGRMLKADGCTGAMSTAAANIMSGSSTAATTLPTEIPAAPTAVPCPDITTT